MDESYIEAYKEFIESMWDNYAYIRDTKGLDINFESFILNFKLFSELIEDQENNYDDDYDDEDIIDKNGD